VSLWLANNSIASLCREV